MTYVRLFFFFSFQNGRRERKSKKMFSDMLVEKGRRGSENVPSVSDPEKATRVQEILEEIELLCAARVKAEEGLKAAQVREARERELRQAAQLQNNILMRRCRENETDLLCSAAAGTSCTRKAGNGVLPDQQCGRSSEACNRSP